MTQLLETQSRVESLAADIIMRKEISQLLRRIWRNSLEIAESSLYQPLRALFLSIRIIADVVEAALTNNPSLAVAESSLEAAQSMVVRKGSGPQTSMSVMSINNRM